jgi:hypothetical protein
MMMIAAMKITTAQATPMSPSVDAIIIEAA